MEWYESNIGLCGGATALNMLLGGVSFRRRRILHVARPCGRSVGRE